VLVRVNLSFPSWVSRGDVPARGDQVFVLGNPGRLRDIYRNGYVSGYCKLDGMDVTLYDLNGYFGDSGSGIFNDRGELVGVVSVLEHQTDGAYMKLMGSFALSFTPDQWKAAAQ
jgi:S1-C subfamily serine protease